MNKGTNMVDMGGRSVDYLFLFQFYSKDSIVNNSMPNPQVIKTISLLLLSIPFLLLLTY